MKKLSFMAAIIALIMVLFALSPAVFAARERAEQKAGAEEYPIVPEAGDGVTLTYDEAAFSLLLSESYGMLRIEETRTLTLTASFDQGWTFSEDYSNFFRSHPERVQITNGPSGSKVFTFHAVEGEYLTLDEMLTVGVYASAAQLPRLEIATEIPFSQIGKSEYVPATFTLTLGTKQYESGNFEGTGSIKGRGNTSWGQPQKPYSIKLDSKNSLLDIPRTKKYAIVPSYSDQSGIRNYLTYKAGLMLAGIEYVPKCEFVEVYLNGSYNGIYLLVERVSIESNKINIEEATADDLTGGYLIEKDVDNKIDFSEDQWFNCPYWANQGRDYFVLKDPEPADETLRSQMLSYLTTYMQNVHNSIMGTGQDDYTRYVDVDSWIDFIIVQELAKNIDGNLKTSCYMFKQSGDDKLYLTAPWDFDLAYGNPETTWTNADPQHNDYYDCPNATSPADFMAINSSCPWFDTLYDDHPEFRSALMQRYTLYRSSMIPAMLRLIDRAAAYLSEAEPRNDARWGKDFTGGVADLRSWLTARIEWLDTQWRQDSEPIDLDYALNADGGSLHFETTEHPFTGTFKDGRIAAVSGIAGMNSAESGVALALRMEAGETLSFDYRVSTEHGYDEFTFNVNGSVLMTASGEYDWQTYTFTAEEAGDYSFTWTYSKDYSVASGSDCVWLDEVVWSGGGSGLPGDVNGDGEITAADALLVMRYAMSLVDELPHIENADINGSGVIDIADALIIMRTAMGIA